MYTDNKNYKKKYLLFTIVLFIFCLNLINCFDARKGLFNRFINLSKNKNYNQIKDNNINHTETEKEKIEITKKNNLKKFLSTTSSLTNSKKIFENFSKLLQSFKNSNSENDYKEYFHNVKVDHFSYKDNRVFSLRYLVKDKYFDKNNPDSPILFYCGNEGPIETFWENSGFVTEYLAEKYKALVIFGEHRFFGKSFPFGGKQDKDPEKNKYLTSAQALSDFVDLLSDYRNENNFPERKIIAFGGSYGGMLSSWARMKFPHIFSGAVASSAPTLLFEDIKKIENSFFKIATDTYKKYDDQCPILIRSSFQKLFDIRNSTIISKNKSVLKALNDIFIPCKNIENSSDIKKLESTIEDALITLAQYNYPYETNFINPTPAVPVKVACEKISEIKNKNKFLKLSPLISSSINFGFNKYNQVDYDDKNKFKYLKAAIDVFFNSTGTQKCLDIGNDNESKEREINGWEYMACTEMIMPMEKNGLTDMFNPEPWDLNKFTNECKNNFESDIRPNWIFNFYGGRNFLKETENYSNIVYINGNMDPWYSGCPKKSNNKKVIILEAESAHHLDLRLPNEKDPKSIIQARKVVEYLIPNWLKN
jgi:lysosomal Pro-X carboxypeptidase